jgi:uncharacterized protein YkwD
MRSRTRIAALTATLAVLVLPASSSADRRGAVAPAGQLQTALVDQLNVLRASHGLVRLRVSPALAAAATAHSTSMAKKGYFSHNSANGASFSSRIAYFYPARGYRSWSVGENLLWASPDVGAVRALKLWLGSPPHRANLLNPRWREVGLAAVHSTSAPGVYHNAPATIVTADFGARTR